MDEALLVEQVLAEFIANEECSPERAEQWRAAYRAGLCVPVEDEDYGLTFALTQAGVELVLAGGTLGGVPALPGARLN